MKSPEDSRTAADWHLRTGIVRQQAGDLEGAVRSYKQAIALDPECFSAYNNLGNLFAALGDFDTALIFLKAAAEIKPGNAEIHNNVGNIYFKLELAQPAVDCYLKAIALQPESAPYYNHLGNALRLQGRYAEAETCLHAALHRRPNYPEAHANLGFLFAEQGRFAEAEEHYRRAIQQQPEYAMAHVCLGHLLLRRGDFTGGWAEQEWRWQWGDFPSPKRNFVQPQWRGESVERGALLLHAEQGFGDTIQFLRYVPLVAELLPGVAIVLEVHPELKRLAAGLCGVSLLLSRGESLPAFDWHCPLMSLPVGFATDLATIPKAVPYLLLDRSRLASSPARSHADLRVGLVWAGAPGNRVDGRRSLRLSCLRGLWKVPGVSFYSLQRGAVEQVAEQPFVGVLPQEGDFAMTASVINGLDLVIAVDTAVAHLAGALGRPVWLMLPRNADWRWLVDCTESPWYPSARLFRQETAGDWEAVVARIAEELAVLAGHATPTKQLRAAAHEPESPWLPC